ncbi:MAG: KamA family radical SAM protein [Polyangiaceae bacterium]|nr:KamA family radical SAM protein [Polyangiaceae bacterium]
MCAAWAAGEPQGSGGPDDWHWQLRHSARTAKALGAALALTQLEQQGALAAERGGLPIAVTPYYLALCDPRDEHCPIRRQVVPTARENEPNVGDSCDPLAEETHTPAAHLVRRYRDRALLLATDRCATYCRFCTRRRRVGRGPGARSVTELRPALDYLGDHPEIRELIISGGDPLVQSTERLRGLLEQVRMRTNVGVIRLATRVPVVLPQRVTAELICALRAYHPLWVMTHFNHPKELTRQAREACRLLVDGGFPVNNQTVLLRGINDDARVLAALFRGLVETRVRPYYLLQADCACGMGHLRTPMQVGVAVMDELQGQLSGIAMPKLMVDAPCGLGKVPVGRDYVVARGAGVTRLQTPGGEQVEYFDPA